MRNVPEKVPVALREEVRRLLYDVRDAPDHETGEARAATFIEPYRSKLPSAVARFKEDLAAGLNRLKPPSLHWKSIRTTDLVEPCFRATDLMHYDEDGN